MNLIRFIKNTIFLFSSFWIWLILKFFKNPPREEKGKPEILFLNLGQIGDLVISSLLFSNEEKLTSLYNCTFLIKKPYYNLFNDYSGDIKIIEVDIKKYKINPLYRLIILQKLNRKGFEKIINLTTGRGPVSEELAIIPRAHSRIRTSMDSRYLGKSYTKLCDKYYNDDFSKGSMNVFEKELSCIKYLNQAKPIARTQLFIGSQTQKNVRKLLNEANVFNEFISINPLTDLKTKEWGINNFRRLVELLMTRMKHDVILLGNESQRNKLEEIVEINRNRIHNFAGNTSLLESSAILQFSSLHIGNDSGFTHIAKSLQTNFICLLGGGSFNQFFPYNISEKDNYLYEKLDCFGCDWNCIQDTVYCMKFSVDDVMKRVNLILS
ncbi:MAG: hypothetical protein K9G44_04125 [Melioribacteraceae bacterium]|nr:hypothetical protein [Melioribacteraceae bacterium]